MKGNAMLEKVESVRAYNNYLGVDTAHPLVSVINFDEVAPIPYFRRYMGVYAMFLKDVKCGDIVYGCNPYDYEDGTLVFVSAGQIYGIDSKGEKIKPSGYALVFHPDLLRGTHLAKKIAEYTFFSYEVNEALHLSKKERKIIVDCLSKINTEIEQNMDKHSKTLIVSGIEMLLNYCMRYYDRQFITRNHVNKDILSRFEDFLNRYLSSGMTKEYGIASVSQCARELNLSVNYFRDLVKKETGLAPLEIIQTKVIDAAKSMIYGSRVPISDISYELGFKYQQHFTRLFKQKIGVSPTAYRKLNQ